MAKRTTLKPIALGYRAVGSQASVEYTKLMGVLKGLTIGQDEPDSTEIEAEFYDSPFDIVYNGQPVTFTFELASYELSELDPLFGGTTTTSSTSGQPEAVYEAATAATTNEFEWKLDFGRGNASIVIYKGLTIGTIKKDEDGALNYAVTITSLVYTDGSQNDHLYKIIGKANPTT